MGSSATADILYSRNFSKDGSGRRESSIRVQGQSPGVGSRAKLAETETRRPASAERTARRQFQATDQPVSWTQASDAMTSQLPRYEAKCVQCRCFQCGSVPLHSDIKGTELPPANILIPLERQLIALQLCRWEFLANVNSRLRSLYAIARPSVCRLSVVCNVRAPYSGGSNFRQYFYGISYLGHPLTSTENFGEIVPGEPLRRGS